MDEKLRGAIMTILETLPIDAEMRFFWHDGCSHLRMKIPGEPELTARLSRATDGIGLDVPATVH